MAQLSSAAGLGLEWDDVAKAFDVSARLQRVTKSLDQGTISTSVLDADDMVFPSLAAGEYTYRVLAYWTTTAGTIGIKYAMAFSGTATTMRYYGLFSQGVASISGSSLAIASDTEVTVSNAAPSPGANWLTIEGQLVVTVAGDLRFRFGSESGSGTITALAGSYMLLQRWA